MVRMLPTTICGKWMWELISLSRWQKPRDLTLQKMDRLLTMSLTDTLQKGNMPTTRVPESHRLVHWNYFGISNQFLFLTFEWGGRGLRLSAFLNGSTSRMAVSVMIPNQWCVERTGLHLHNRFHTLTLGNIQRIRSGQCPQLLRGIFV